MGQLINKRGCCHQAAPPLSCAKLLYLVGEAAGRRGPAAVGTRAGAYTRARDARLRPSHHPRGGVILAQRPAESAVGAPWGWHAHRDTP